jgi:hypothetical protein
MEAVAWTAGATTRRGSSSSWNGRRLLDRLRLTTERSRTHKQRRSIFLVQKPLAAPALSPLCGAVCVWQLWLRLLCLNQESRQRVSFFSQSQTMYVSQWVVFDRFSRRRPSQTTRLAPPRIHCNHASHSTAPFVTSHVAARCVLRRRLQGYSAPACRHSFAVCPLVFNWHSLPSSTPILLRSKTHAHGLGSSAR